MDHVYDVVTITIMVLGFIGNAFYLKGTFDEKLKNLSCAITELKKTVRYKDTCEAQYNGLKDRVDHLDRINNGKSR